jgi:ATP-dependent helicase/nuclease subunit A
MVDSGFYHYVGAMQGGTSRQANLRLLIDKAGQFETLGSGGLFEFIAFFEKLKASSGDMGTASSITEGEDVIRLMSIHKSKGLEFPVVILAGAGKQFNLRDTYDKALLHKDYGVGLRFVDPEKRYYSESLPQMIMKRRLKMESLAEEMRILYVAMTRAVNQLILIGSSGRFESDLKRWVRGPSTFNLVGGKSYLDWILTILSRHPDGAPIRDISTLPVFGNSRDGNCKWTIDFIRKDQLLLEGLHASKARSAVDVETKSGENKNEAGGEQSASIPVYTEKDIENWRNEMDRRLSWTYPKEKTVNMPFKLSVSDLKRASKVGIQGANVHIPPLTPKPKFLAGKTKKSGAEIGTLHHFVMQHLDFKTDLTPQGIQAQVRNMVHLNLMDQEDLALIRFDDIARFFTTELGERLLQAKQVYREVPFILNKVINDTETMVQGIIDCYFEEEGGLVVLDYKTDYTGKSGVDAIASTYRVQVELYKEALEKLLEKPVKASYLYFFDAGTGVKVE